MTTTEEKTTASSGSSITTTTKNQWKKEIIPRIRDIELPALLVRGANRISVRQMYYRLYSQNLLVNVTKFTYGNFDGALTDARLAGIIPIDAFTDDSRAQVETIDSSITPDVYALAETYSFRDDVMNSYQPPRWYKQPIYVEVWVEKQSLWETFTGILQDRQVVIVANKGFAGLAFLNEAAKRLSEAFGPPGIEKIVILYFGDLDPSGDAMDEIIVRRLGQINALQGYGLPIDNPERFEFRRVALKPEHIERYNLPSMEDVALKAKLKNDPRAESFEKKYGSLFQYEVDALSAIVPDEFANMVLQAVDELYDVDVWNKYKHEISEELVKQEFDKLVQFTDEATKTFEMMDSQSSSSSRNDDNGDEEE
jgi:hypothetical protein